MELEKILEKLDRMKEGDENAEKTDEQRAKEIEETGKKQQEDADLSTESQNNDSKNQDSVNDQNSGNTQGQNNNLPEFFKDFEGKAQVSPDDIKAILSDPTKGQQLIDWAKTQNKIVKEVPGIQNVMKQVQSQPKNGTEGEADKGTTDDGNKQQKLRPFQDYLEPLGKIMKTQADCDQAIQFFTNLKNTKPAAPANNSTEPAQNNTQATESSSEQAK